MNLAVHPGSFDPLILGHVDITAHTITLFGIVVTGIAYNATKAGRHLFNVHERLHLVREAVSHLPGVKADVVPGLLAGYYTQHGANAIIKDLRSGSDLDARLPMVPLNRDLEAPETVSLLASAAYAHISSSLVKGIAGYGRDVSVFVPPTVVHVLTVRLTQAPGSVAHDDIGPGLVPPGTPPNRFVGVGHT